MQYSFHIPRPQYSQIPSRGLLPHRYQTQHISGWTSKQHHNRRSLRSSVVHSFPVVVSSRLALQDKRTAQSFVTVAWVQREATHRQRMAVDSLEFRFRKRCPTSCNPHLRWPGGLCASGWCRSNQKHALGKAVPRTTGPRALEPLCAKLIPVASHQCSRRCTQCGVVSYNAIEFAFK